MFDCLEGVIWLDGRILPWEEAKIHVMTHALHYGTSVYEGIRSYENVMFEGLAHYQRLLRSAELLDFHIPYTAETLFQATQQLLDQGKYTLGYIRALSWCGSQSMSVSHRASNIHTAIMVWERPMPYSPAQYAQGLHLHMARWRRPHPDSAPVHSKAGGLYMISAMAKRAAELQGFDDAVLLDTEGRVAEATSSNLFCVRDQRIITPFPHSFLKGLTRAFVMEEAARRGVPVEERDFGLDQLLNAQEVFLTGTAVGIVPVASIHTGAGRHVFTPGPMTRQVQAWYEAALPVCPS
jgi:branched-chain amino acid aminotransferase